MRIEKHDHAAKCLQLSVQSSAITRQHVVADNLGDISVKCIRVAAAKAKVKILCLVRDGACVMILGSEGSKLLLILFGPAALFGRRR